MGRRRREKAFGFLGSMHDKCHGLRCSFRARIPRFFPPPLESSILAPSRENARDGRSIADEEGRMRGGCREDQRERERRVASPRRRYMSMQINKHGHRYDTGPWTSVLDVHTRPPPYPSLSLVASCCAAPEQMGTAGIEGHGQGVVRAKGKQRGHSAQALAGVRMMS